MSRLTLSRLSVLSTVATLAVVWATACGSDDSKSDTNSTVTGTAGPTTGGTVGGPTTGAPNTTSGTTGITNAGPTTTGTASTGSSSGTGGATTGGDTTGMMGSTTSSGGTSTSTEGGPATTGTSTTGGGGGPGTQADCSPAEGEVPILTLTEVTGGINVPVDLTHPPGDDRMFVISLEGTVHIIKDGQLVQTPFLSLGNKVAVGGAPGDERGLLGIAFHPDYAENGLFYLHYSAGQGVPGAETSDTVIEEYHVSSDPDVADAASARVVLVVDQPSNGGGIENHKGGSIEFGPDGLLYIGLGDGGGSGDAMGNAQNTSVLLGKILRIDPVESGGMPYTTPPDNLVQDVASAAPEIWDYGLRNPFRFSFDVCNGDLYIGDVGQMMYEEITIEKAGDGHKNYGWNITEALHCYGAQSCDQTGITPPLIELERPNTSITGGSVYRGSSMPSLRGAYFYADYGSGNVWYTRYDRDAGTVAQSTSVTQDLNVENIVAIKNGNDGELYFVSLVADGKIGAGNLGEGAIYKLTAAE